jgi:DtxR family transcriptional regulator, Mn-dependent transcriptional regulator
MENSLTEENYLKALLNLANPAGEVNVKELSRVLGTKMPTVTSMMQKLARKKLVHYETYRPPRLTEKGRKEAALIIRKHRLMEMFLVEKMGFGWEAVHQIAEQIEHIHAPAFFEKMDELLGYPKMDPHGSPIPDRNGKMHWKPQAKLSDFKAGSVVKLCGIADSSDDFLRFLNSRDLRLGVAMTINEIEEFDGSMTVSYGKHRKETLSGLVCDRLFVES